MFYDVNWGYCDHVVMCSVPLLFWLVVSICQVIGLKDPLRKSLASRGDYLYKDLV